MAEFKKPSLIVKPAGYCGGCGHGIGQRLIAETVQELGLVDKTVACVDIACGFWSLDAVNFDGIAGPHGRCAAVATAIKKVRPDGNIYVYAGDGASYSIGLAETMYAAMRDVPITMIVVNNGIFGMTGGQMSPATTLIGDKTSSSQKGRTQEYNGSPNDMLATLATIDVEFIARGALYSPAEVNKTKSYIKKAFENQTNKKGFSIVELLSPCPTNWGIDPVKSNERVRDEMTKTFPLGVVVDRGGKK